jgi:hypothetical protein
MSQNLLLQTPPESKPVPLSAFTVHGMWTPGVQLMRKISFQAKAAIIIIIFLIPIAVSTQFLIDSLQTQLAFSKKELLGTRYAKTILPLQQKLQESRQRAVQWNVSGQKPSEWDALQISINELLQRIQQIDAELGSILGSTKALLDLQKSVEAGAKQSPKNLELDSVIALHSTPSTALIALLETVLDGSNLILDPDIDTYYMMDGALLRIPTLTDNASKLRDVAWAIQETGSASPPLEKRATADRAVGSFMEAQLSVAVGKVGSVHPNFTQSLQMTEAIKAFNTLANMLDDPFKAGPVAILASAEMSAKGFYTGQNLLVDKLHVQLQALGLQLYM